MKCNLDCTYCPTGIYGGHDNTQRHPPLEECLRTIDFMFEYADIYMSAKPKGIKYVILNVYGGEAIHHPDIVEILTEVHNRYLPYKHKWHLTVTTTTNAIVSQEKILKIIPLIDEFTVSYHAENSPKQKQQFKQNILTVKQSGRRIKCVVLMHSDPEGFDDSRQMIEWLTQQNIKHLPRQLDHAPTGTQFNYNATQVVWFEQLYNKSLANSVVIENKVDLADTGRACCGGRMLCENQQFKNRQKFVSNKFAGWYCSVNYFFLYVKQVNGEVYVNKDCKMNFDGAVGPIGHLNNTQALLAQAQQTNKPTIQCAKERCYCGLCAPKAENLDTYRSIMRKYEILNSDLLPKSQRTN